VHVQLSLQARASCVNALIAACAQMPKEMVRCHAAHGQTVNGWPVFYLTRRRDWEDAFRSLYYSLWSIPCPTPATSSSSSRTTTAAAAAAETEITSFYTRTTTSTILWRSTVSTATGERAVSAVISQSTRALRRQLEEASISFSMPLHPQAATCDARDADVELCAALRDSAPRGGYLAAEDRSRPQLTLLLLQGQMAVHGLFDIMLEAAGPGSGGGSTVGGRAQDVPLLLSRRPFMHGTLRQVQAYFSGDVQYAAAHSAAQQQQSSRQRQQQQQQQRSSSAANSSSSSSRSSCDAEQVLELNGHVLPCALRDMAAAAARVCEHATFDGVTGSADSSSSRRHGDGASLFKMTLRADEDTAYFNAGILGKAAAANLVRIEGVPVGYSEHTYDCCSVEPPL
jgi:hypothetical protein